MNDKNDIREALYNDRPTGPAPQIQLPTSAITRLHGILFDLDPKFLQPDNEWFRPDPDPDVFLRNVSPVLNRHPLACHGEVRASGTGLHVIVWIDPPLELTSAAQQDYWNQVVKAVQRTLPIDPTMPAMTALTRPVGATNTKNGASVRCLKPGQPVSATDIEGFVQCLAAAPFRGVVQPLLGDERISPCPVCGRPESTLSVLDITGHCYGECGKVPLSRVLDRVFVNVTGKHQEKD
jgi:hypothetical protein